MRLPLLQHCVHHRVFFWDTVLGGLNHLNVTFVTLVGGQQDGGARVHSVFILRAAFRLVDLWVLRQITHRTTDLQSFMSRSSACLLFHYILINGKDHLP